MDKHQLAQELRQRQYNKGLVPRRMIDALSDDDIIDSYITCSDCGEKQVEGQILENAIEAAHNSDQFFSLCDSFANARHLRDHGQRQQKLPLKGKNVQRNKNVPFKRRDW
jgi:hypothetical protein